PLSGRPEVASPFRPARTALERLLVALWSEVLGLQDLGVDDNFFELGGDSLQAALLINKLQERLGQTLYVVAVFDAPTVSLLADYLVRHYPDAESRLGGEAGRTEDGRAAVSGAPAAPSPAIDAVVVERFRRLVTPLAPLGPRAAERPNPP